MKSSTNLPLVGRSKNPKDFSGGGRSGRIDLPHPKRVPRFDLPTRGR